MSELDQQDLIDQLKDDVKKITLLACDISDNYLNMFNTKGQSKAERLKFAQTLEWQYNRYSTIMAIMMDQIISLNEKVHQLQ